jgi:N-acetylglucosamine malate deacetylase 1
MASGVKTDILAFGAHPDDVELAVSGTLIKAARRGAATAVVTLTRGEMGTRGTVEKRAEEFSQASAVMGLSAHRMMTLPDGKLASEEGARLAVIREIRDLRPALVLLPYWEDRHPDHPAASRLIQDAVFLSGLRRVETGQEPHRPSELLYYMASWEFEPSFIVDISDVMEEKKKAIRCYESQVFNASYQGREEQTYISSEHFWELLLARAAHYGRLIGKRFGEPFKIRGLVEIADLMQAFGSRRY